MFEVLDALRLEDLPSEETALIEYKSSRLADDNSKLKAEISKAASGFWNSGGGTLVLGVDNTGKPDGGLPPRIGRKPLKEWLELAVHSVEPVAQYAVRLIACPPAPLPCGEQPGQTALLGFARSRQIPHMANDSKYYVRAGAHTQPASQFIVEALWAQRSVSQPDLLHAIRFKPGHDDLVQLGVIASNDAPAIDVEIEIKPTPPLWKRCEADLPMRVPLIDRQHPFFTDLTIAYIPEHELPEGTGIEVRYRDRAGETYEYKRPLDITRAIGPLRFVSKGFRDLDSRLEDIGKTLRSLVEVLGKGRGP